MESHDHRPELFISFCLQGRDLLKANLLVSSVQYTQTPLTGLPSNSPYWTPGGGGGGGGGRGGGGGPCNTGVVGIDQLVAKYTV